eukprot:6491772-Prymnesium_polylepis.2
MTSSSAEYPNKDDGTVRKKYGRGRNDWNPVAGRNLRSSHRSIRAAGTDDGLHSSAGISLCDAHVKRTEQPLSAVAP